MTRQPVLPKTRGQCGTCSGDYQVRDDGRLPQRRGGCDGSGRWPQAYRAPGGKWKARQA